MSIMVTRIRRGARGHLYIKEWMAHRAVSPERLADRLGVARETVYRWLREQHRLDPGKLAQIASALDCEPMELWRLPTDPSLDALVADAPAELRQTVTDVVRRLVGKTR